MSSIWLQTIHMYSHSPLLLSFNRGQEVDINNGSMRDKSVKEIFVRFGVPATVVVIKVPHATVLKWKKIAQQDDMIAPQ